MAINLEVLKQLIMQRQWMIWNERNDNSPGQAIDDLHAFMESRDPRWQAVIYSNNRGLVLIHTGQNKRYEALRYRTPENKTAAKMVYTIAQIQLPDWAEKKLSDTFGACPITALAELDTDQPRVHVNPKNFPILPVLPT